MMEFEADRMTGLLLTEDAVRPELNVVLEEQNMRVANNPAARLGEQMEAALYLNHPYGRPVIGWRHEIEQLNRDDALAFYRRFYTPNNAIAVNAGATYDSMAVDATRFSFSATAKPTASLQQVEQAMDAVIAEIADKGITHDELERAKARMIADAVYANDSQRSMAQWYGAALATGSTVEEVRTWPDRIRAVEAQAVREAARRWFDARRSVTGYLVREMTPEEKRS